MDMHYELTSEQSGWHACFMFGKSPVQILGRTSAILTKDLRGLFTPSREMSDITLNYATTSSFHVLYNHLGYSLLIIPSTLPTPRY